MPNTPQKNLKNKTIGVLLAGAGCRDGSEIHEAVSCLLALSQQQANIICFAPDVSSTTINHLTNKNSTEQRNVLVESSRLWSEVQPIEKITAAQLDGLVVPGGFGVAINLCSWATQGADATVQPQVSHLILELVQQQKPIVGCCMGAILLALVLSYIPKQAILTVGSSQEPSPYDIPQLQQQVQALGHQVNNCSIEEVALDENSNIITAPCYLMEASLAQLYSNIENAIHTLTKRI